MATRTTFVSTSAGQPQGRAAPGRARRTVPAWAFWTVVVVAIVFGILAGVIWFFLQSCRTAILDPANCNCPTIIQQTCCRVDSSGNTLPACKTACTTNADCPSYAPTCGGDGFCA